MATDANGKEITENQAVTFDDRQQARVNELIREKMGEAAREVRTQLTAKEAEATALATELAVAKAALKTATPGEKKAAKEDVEALQNQINEMKQAQLLGQQQLEQAQRQAADKVKEVENAKNETLKVRKEVAIQKAATKLNFVDPAIVAKLTDDSVKWDEQRGRFIVINTETGTERMNSAFEPLTLEEFYKEFATGNPFLVRADARGGVGSTQSGGLSSNGKYTVEQIFGPKSDTKLANKLGKENINEYRRLRAVAVEHGLLSK